MNELNATCDVSEAAKLHMDTPPRIEAENHGIAVAPYAISLGQNVVTEPQHWFVAYTCPRHEKYVSKQLADRHIEAFLPLYRETRKWKDRRKLVELALFPGYIFVRIHERERLKVLQLAGVVRFVTHQGRLAALNDEEIESLRSGLEKGVLAQPHPLLRVGRRVRVSRGPMAGVEGVLLRRKDKVRVVVSIEAIQQSIALELDASDLDIC
jgi:transcription antitermination factor NusG